MGGETSFRAEAAPAAGGQAGPGRGAARARDAADDLLLADPDGAGEWEQARANRDSGRSPEESGLLGRALMVWMAPLVRRCWRKLPVLPAHLPGLRSEYRSSSLAPRFKSEWERGRPARKGGSGGFFRAMLRVPVIRRTLLIGSLCSALQGLLSTVARPLVLSAVIEAVAGAPSLGHAAQYVVLFAAVVLLEGWFGVQGRQLLSEEFGTQFQVAASSVVYDKMLRLDTQSARQGLSSESGLIGNDVVRAYENIRTASNLPMAISGVVGGIAVLLVMLGPAALVGIGTMLVIMIGNVMASRVTHRIEHAGLRVSDERLAVLGSAVEGIHAVKLFGWGPSFERKLRSIRERECRHVRDFRLAYVSSIACGRASPALSSMATLVFFALSGSELTIAIAYATVTIFQALRLGLIYVPLGATATMAFDVTLRRLNEYLGRPERAPARETAPGSAIVAEIESSDLGWALPAAGEEPAPPVLRDVTVRVAAGEVLAVVGTVGSGKSTLLQSLCQAILPVRVAEGATGVRTCASVGFAPQKPFVTCGTIRQNIVLGRPLDQERFDSALRRSGLWRDVSLFPHGVHTEIGERGTTLSGGQQSRLGVARALYGKPDLLVLDDPLSAVDAEACAHIFKHAVLGGRERVGPDGAARPPAACVIALNQVGLLPKVDRILYVRGGRVAAQGTYEELMALPDPSFRAFVTVSQRQSETEDSDSVPSRGLSELSQGLGAAGQGPATPTAATGQDASSSILRAEATTQGEISSSVYRKYVKAMGPVLFGFCVLLSLAGYVMMAIGDTWLTLWSEALEEPDGYARNVFYTGVYVALNVGFALCILSSSWIMCFGGVRASRTLHNDAVHRLLNAPMSWFESNTSGRILSRFSGDLAKVDLMLSLVLDHAVHIAATLIVLVAIICAAVPAMTVLVLVCAALYCVLLRLLDRASREVRRISNNAMSPLLSNASEGARGRDLMVVMRCNTFFEARHRLATDEYARANFVAGSTVNLAILMSQALSFVVAVGAAVFLVLLHRTFPSDLIGVSLTYAFLVPYFAATMSQVAIRLNSFFTSLERLLEYSALPQERSSWPCKDAEQAGGESPDPSPPATEWPTKGAIAFRDVRMRYRPGLPLVLREASFEVPAGASVGICGASGAGKSSLIACLFRLVEVESGAVLVDGRDVSTIALHTLRSRLTILMQDPILHEGTVASNLDPTGEHSEPELREALRLVGLADRVELDSAVKQGGRNWSSGERQLLSFARATLRDSRVLVLDEPTSAVDMTTDEKIQAVVRREFQEARGCTVLCVAHRLNTICDFDLVMVMQAGRVREMAPPAELLEDSTSGFSQLVAALGPASQEQVRAKANNARAA